MEKCAIYCRQSVGDDDVSESVETQRERLRERAASMGYEVAGVFADLNTSGKTYEIGAEDVAKFDLAFQKWCETTSRTKKFRAGLGNLLKRLSEFGAVFVWDLTRLYRPVNGSFLEAHINQIFMTSGVKLICLDAGEINFNNFTTSLVTTIQNRINDEQIKLQIEKSQAVLKRLKDAGEWDVACFKSFGYRSSGRKREIEIDEYEADIVKKIFDLYLKGFSYYKICKTINKNFYADKKRILFKTQMYRILLNPIYCGYYKNSAGELIKAKPIEGKELISFDVWKRVQELYNENKRSPRRAFKNWLPLAGRFYCGYCGEKIHGVNCGGNYVQYRCMQYERRGLTRAFSCHNAITWTNVVKDKPHGDFLKDALLGMTPIYFMQKLNENRETGRQEIQEIDVELLNLEKKIGALTENFMEGILDEVIYKSALKTMTKKRQELNQKRDELQSIADKNSYDVLNLLIDLNALEDRDDEDLTEIYRWTFKKITIFKDKVLIETPKGDLELPCKRFHRAKEFPHHEIIVGERPIIVYHYDEFDENEDNWEFMKNIGGVEFYLQK